jgi:hypothetical protein
MFVNLPHIYQMYIYPSLPPGQRAIVAAAGACNVLLLKGANLVGYTTGVQGLKLMRPLVTTWSGASFLLWYWMCMWAGVVVMLRIRGWSFNESIAAQGRPRGTKSKVV